MFFVNVSRYIYTLKRTDVTCKTRAQTDVMCLHRSMYPACSYVADMTANSFIYRYVKQKLLAVARLGYQVILLWLP